MNLKTTKKLLVFLLGLLLTACNSNDNTSNNTVNIKIDRFEQDLYLVDNSSWDVFTKDVDSLKRKYKDFYDVYFINIMNAQPSLDTNYLEIVDLLKSNTSFNDLKKDIDSVFPDLKQQEKELSAAFSNYKKYYPNGTIPRVISYMSDFQVGVSTVDTSVVAIELDMFLGKGYKFYHSPEIDFPEFIQRKLNKEHIPALVMQAWSMQLFPIKEDDKTLLNKMIYNGKILYFMDKMLPAVADSIKIGYSAKQTLWCEKYKAEIWTDIVNRDMLYSTDELKYAKYLNDAPFTSGLDNDSAPMLGVWTGWQIVKSFMQHNKSISLDELMNIDNPQYILENSKYKPK